MDLPLIVTYAPCTSKGEAIVVHTNRMFVCTKKNRNRNNDSLRYYKCSSCDHGTLVCNIINNAPVLNTVNTQCRDDCMEQPYQILANRAMQKLIHLTRTLPQHTYTARAIDNIVRTELLTHPHWNEIVMYYPSAINCINIIGRKRHQMQPNFNPQNWAEMPIEFPINLLNIPSVLDIPEQLFVQRYEAYMHEGEERKLLILGTQANLLRLGNAHVIGMDGTFKVCPTPFYQLYTVSSFRYQNDDINNPNVRSMCFPRLYCLLSNKTADVYIHLFNAIRNLLAEQNIPLNHIRWRVNMDYETASRNSIVSVFDPQHMGNTITIHGCQFHYAAAIYKHVKENGNLLAMYKSPEHPLNFLTFCRKLYALPFIEPASVHYVYFNLWDSQSALFRENEDIILFSTYFINEWIDHPPEPQAYINMFNCFNINNITTSNHIEGMHNKYKNAFGVQLNLGNFITELMKFTKQEMIAEAAIDGGGEMPRKSTQLQSKENRLSNLKAMYTAVNGEHYLDHEWYLNELYPNMQNVF